MINEHGDQVMISRLLYSDFSVSKARVSFGKESKDVTSSHW